MYLASINPEYPGKTTTTTKYLQHQKSVQPLPSPFGLSEIYLFYKFGKVQLF